MRSTPFHRPAAIAAGVLAVLGLLATVQAAAAAAVQITVAPAIAPYGTPFSLKVTGLRPGELATIKAVSTDVKKITWESKAVFEADVSGAIDVARQAPASGDYTGVDIFGLAWSMRPTNSKSTRPIAYADDEVNGWTIDFSVTDSAGATASTRFRCVYHVPGQGLVRVPLEKDGLYGYLYHPAKGGPFPAVLILGGSNGGLYEWLAQAFASNGFAALTLAYFGHRDLPPELVDIPIETFDRAVAWLKTQPAVRADRIGVAGGSRGGELALFLASRSADYRAVVAWSPARHLWEGMTQRFFAPDYVSVASWTLGGKPLPFVPFVSTPEEKAQEMKGALDSLLPVFTRSLAQTDPARVAQAVIPVERIKAPILLVSGTDDRTWPSTKFSDEIVAKLKQVGFPYEVTHVVNDKGGHPSFLPWLMTANRGSGSIDGGTPQANVQGGYRSWTETIAFLHRHLDR
jgi:dienelactone hydrolase